MLSVCRLLEDSETIDRSGRKLSRGRRLLEEARSTGAAVLGDLEHQRETLQRARNRVSGENRYSRGYR